MIKLSRRKAAGAREQGGRTGLLSFLQKNSIPLMAFLISILIVLIAYGARGIFPFGDKTVLKVDLYHQYAPYIEELRSRILAGKSLLYSWEGGLGKDFVSQMAYYTASPVNLLIFLFSEKQLPEMIAFFIILKIGFCSASGTWYLKEHFRRNDPSVLCFGMLYGFCAFLTCYYWNIMWLDTVALFPFIVRGTERLVKEEKAGGYYAALTMTMIVNFYLAVLVCVITALIFIADLVICMPRGTNRERLLWIRSRFVPFAVLSILAALTSMFILAPVGMALMATAVSDSTFPSFKVYPNVWQLLTNHFLGARPAVLARNEDLPNIYSGTVTMVLLPLYFANRAVSRKEKISLSLILAVMLLCSCIKPLDYMIHGMHFPANLPHRYTFMYSFLLIFMGCKAFLRLEHADLRVSYVVCGIYLAVILITEYCLAGKIEETDRVLSGSDILLNACAMALYLAVLTIYQKRWILAGGSTFAGRTVLQGILLVCIILECVFSSITNLENSSSREAYMRYMEDAPRAVAYMDSLEEGRFYRTEFRRFTTINDASLYHYNGFSQFSSLEPGGISSFMQSLGVAATGNSFRYYDPTPLVDAVFDLGYIMNKDGPHPKEERYEFLKQFGTVWVYRNTRCLPLAFLADPALLYWDVSDSQPFAVQNDFIHRAAGIEDDMFTLIEPDKVETEYITVSSDGSDAQFSYKVTDPGNLSAEPAVHAVFTSEKDQYLYLYVDAGNAIRFLYKNDSVNEDRELSAGRSMIDVGHVSKGEKIRVDFKLTRRGAFEKTWRESGSVALYAAGYHDDVFQKAYDRLSLNGLDITDFSDTRISGTVKAESDSVLFTSIPVIRGWEIFLDGEKADPAILGENGVLGLRVPTGKHTVTFRYRNKLLLPSVLISLIGLAVSLKYLNHHSRVIRRRSEAGTR